MSSIQISSDQDPTLPTEKETRPVATLQIIRNNRLEFQQLNHKKKLGSDEDNEWTVLIAYIRPELAAQTVMTWTTTW